MKAYTLRRSSICRMLIYGAGAVVILVCAGMRSSRTDGAYFPNNVPLSNRPKLSPLFYTAEVIQDPDHHMLDVQGMNNNGDIVGLETGPDLEDCHAFFWAHGKLGDISSLYGLTMTSAMMINDDQQILGNAVYTGRCDDTPILYKRKMSVDLRTLKGGNRVHSVYAIARDGRMIGLDGNGKNLLYSQGAWRDFVLPSGKKISSTYRNLVMNDKGDVAGVFYEQNGQPSQRAEIGGKEYVLKGLSHANSTILIGMSDNGIVAGNVSLSTSCSTSCVPAIHGDSWSMLSAGQGGAFTWSVRAGARELPALKGCSVPTVNVISSSGDIAGTCVDAKGRKRLTLWRDGKAEDLFDLTPDLENENVVDVCAINNQGQMCVEVQNGIEKIPYLLTPPVKSPSIPICSHESSNPPIRG